jgi:putative transposase
VYALPTPPRAEELAFLSALDKVYTEYPFFGQRRIRVILRNEHHLFAGRDRIRSGMATLGLDTIYQKPKTSVAHPGHAIYPYLLRHTIAAYPNHIWGTDITYIPIIGGYVYLVAMLDWFSRYVLAWQISARMESHFCVTNLRNALHYGTPGFHNSDQGSQFTSADYIATLKEHASIAISMDGRGRCMDNIFTERLWRTVKYEDIYLKGYRTLEEAHDGISAFFTFYNTKRPHQSLGYKTPADVYFAGGKH